MRLARLLLPIVLAATCWTGIAGHGASTAAAATSDGRWLSVSGGPGHTCAVSASNSLWCWGDNKYGQTGIGFGDGSTKSIVLNHYAVGRPGTWSPSVAAGGAHSCGISTAKDLYCWGRDTNGQVGDGKAQTVSTSLHRVGAAGVWTSVTAGQDHTCGITTAKNLYCWGFNGYGQVGNGTGEISHLGLYRVGKAGVWSSVNAGWNFTCGITTAKNLYCWGDDEGGQIGDGSASQRAHYGLYRVGAAGVWKSVSAGGAHVCGVTTAEDIYCWGANGGGQVGDGTVNTARLTLYRVFRGNGHSVTAGSYATTCAVTTAQNLFCWGLSDYGQTGDGGAAQQYLRPHQVGASGVWRGSEIGYQHSCALTTATDLYCWGRNDTAQIGDGTKNSPRLTMYREP